MLKANIAHMYFRIVFSQRIVVRKNCDFNVSCVVFSYVLLLFSDRVTCKIHKWQMNSFGERKFCLSHQNTYTAWDWRKLSRSLKWQSRETKALLFSSRACLTAYAVWNLRNFKSFKICFKNCELDTFAIWRDENFFGLK